MATTTVANGTDKTAIVTGGCRNDSLGRPGVPDDMGR